MTDSEIRAFLAAEGYPEHVQRAGRRGLIERWVQFVEEVERGYRLGLDDYRNDLDVRGILARLGLDAEVAEWDARLERLLVNRERRVWRGDSAARSGKTPFWEFGYPRNASGSLLEDLRSEGLVEM